LGALPKILIDDPDASLFPALLDGVPTGIHKDIPANHVFSPWILPKMTRMLMCQRISASGNRRRTTLPDMTFSLLQEELRQGWIQPFPGDLGQAQLHRPPRLVMDPFGMLSS